MPSFLSMLLFILYKAGIIGIYYFSIQYYKLRFDIIAFYFYLFLTFFQFLFIIFQAFSGEDKKKPETTVQYSAIFQYTPIITMMMEILILGLTSYYLYNLENDLMTLLFVFTALIPVHTVYYYLFSMIFGFIIKKRNVRVKGASLFPIFLFTIITFLEPAAYIFFKYFYSGKENLLNLQTLNSGMNMTRIDIILFVIIMILNSIVVFLFFYYKETKAKKIYSLIGNLSLVSAGEKIKIDDANEFGYIESGLMEFQDRLIGEKGNITLLNDYISKNIRDEITKSGLILEGEEKTAAVATIRFKFSLSEYTPEKYIKMTNSIFTLIGEYADEYEAYPFFQLNKAVVVYGVPYYYEHEKFNAIEATQETIIDIESLIKNEGGEIAIHSGLFSGTVVVGAFNTKGRGLKEYSVAGSGVELSERIALAAENIDVKMLVGSGMVESLKNKFYPEKSFKLKLKNNEEIVVSSLKV